MAAAPCMWLSRVKAGGLPECHRPRETAHAPPPLCCGDFASFLLPVFATCTSYWLLEQKQPLCPTQDTTENGVADNTWAFLCFHRVRVLGQDWPLPVVAGGHQILEEGAGLLRPTRQTPEPREPGSLPDAIHAATFLSSQEREDWHKITYFVNAVLSSFEMIN